MTPDLFLLLYLFIALIVMVIFNIEPAGALVFPLLPIIIIKELILEYKNKKSIIECDKKIFKRTQIPTFDEFVDKSKND